MKSFGTEGTEGAENRVGLDDWGSGAKLPKVTRRGGLSGVWCGVAVDPVRAFWVVFSLTRGRMGGNMAIDDAALSEHLKSGV